MNWKIFGLLTLGAILFLWLIKAPIASWYCTKSMGVPVRLSNISIWPSETTIRNFAIKNPKGFKSKRALDIKKTRANYQFKEIAASPSEIDLVVLKDVTLVVEFSNPLGTENNWTAIGKNMKKSEKKNSGVTIHKLAIHNLTVETIGLVEPAQITKYDYIEMNEVSSNSGFPTSPIIQDLFKQADIEKYLPNVFELPVNGVENILHL